MGFRDEFEKMERKKFEDSTRSSTAMNANRSLADAVLAEAQKALQDAAQVLSERAMSKAGYLILSRYPREESGQPKQPRALFGRKKQNSAPLQAEVVARFWGGHGAILTDGGQIIRGDAMRAATSPAGYAELAASAGVPDGAPFATIDSRYALRPHSADEMVAATTELWEGPREELEWARWWTCFSQEPFAAILNRGAPVIGVTPDGQPGILHVNEPGGWGDRPFSLDMSQLDLWLARLVIVELAQ